MVNEFPFGTSQSGKWDYLFRISVCPGIFQWDEPKNRLPFTSQPEFPGLFVVNGKQPRSLIIPLWLLILPNKVRLLIGFCLKAKSNFVLYFDLAADYAGLIKQFQENKLGQAETRTEWSVYFCFITNMWNISSSQILWSQSKKNQTIIYQILAVKTIQSLTYGDSWRQTLLASYFNSNRSHVVVVKVFIATIKFNNIIMIS